MACMTEADDRCACGAGSLCGNPDADGGNSEANCQRFQRFQRSSDLNNFNDFDVWLKKWEDIDFSIVFGLEMRCLNSNAFILTIFIGFHFRNLMISDEAISTLVPPTAPWVLVSKEGRACGRFVDLLLISDSIYEIFMIFCDFLPFVDFCDFCRFLLISARRHNPSGSPGLGPFLQPGAARHVAVAASPPCFHSVPGPESNTQVARLPVTIVQDLLIPFICAYPILFWQKTKNMFVRWYQYDVNSDHIEIILHMHWV